VKSGPNKFGKAAAGLMVLLGLAALQADAARLPATDTTVNTYQSTETVRLTVGHSMVMNTQVPLKRVYVGNPMVLLSYTAGPTQIVLTAKATGTSSLMVWDVNGSSKLYTIEVDIDPTAVQDALKVEYPKEPITATVTEDHIALSGDVTTKEVADGAQKLAEAYSKLVVSSLQITGHPREVRLKVRIAEVDRSKLVQFGVNLLSGGKQVATTSTTQFPGTSITGIGATGPTLGSLTTTGILNPLTYFYYNVAHGIGASIQDLAQHNVLQILAEPTLSAMSGQPASFLSGGEFPYPTIQSSAGSAPVVTISFRPYGIKVDFTPYVSADGMIRLKVAPEVSSLDYANAVQISGYTIPAISTRRAETQVELKSGQTFMIGGLLDHQTTEQFAHTPGIASIPILGELFKSKNNNHSVTELMVFVTAELVDPNAEPAPSDPKPSVPSLHRDNFDNQLHKMHGVDPNTNSNTGKATTPVAPQNQASPASEPVTATAAPVTPPPAAPLVMETPVVADVAAPVQIPDAIPVAMPAATPAPAPLEATPVVYTPPPALVIEPVVAEAPAPVVYTPPPAPVSAPVVAEAPAPVEAPVAPEPEPAAVAVQATPAPATPVAETPAPAVTAVSETPAPAAIPDTPSAAFAPAAATATAAPADAAATATGIAPAPEPAMPALLAAPDSPGDDSPAPPATSSNPSATPATTPTPAAAPEPENKPEIARLNIPETLAAPQANDSAVASRMRLKMKLATN
jgi:pilus assembly protein CpaC